MCCRSGLYSFQVHFRFHFRNRLVTQHTTSPTKQPFIIAQVILILQISPPWSDLCCRMNSLPATIVRLSSANPLASWFTIPLSNRKDENGTRACLAGPYLGDIRLHRRPRFSSTHPNICFGSVSYHRVRIRFCRDRRGRLTAIVGIDSRQVEARNCS